MKRYLVAYDISDPRRLAKVRKIVYGYALGGQKSALEVPLDKRHKKELIESLGSIIDVKQDRIHLIPYQENGVIMLGKGAVVVMQNEGVVIV